jgi:hypothetical protein
LVTGEGGGRCLVTGEGGGRCLVKGEGGGRCTHLTDEAYVAVAEACPNLRVLRLYACMRESDFALAAFGANLSELTVIDLCGAHSITGTPSPLPQQLPLVCSTWVDPRTLCFGL